MHVIPALIILFKYKRSFDSAQDDKPRGVILSEAKDILI